MLRDKIGAAYTQYVLSGARHHFSKDEFLHFPCLCQRPEHVQTTHVYACPGKNGLRLTRSSLPEQGLPTPSVDSICKFDELIC